MVCVLRWRRCKGILQSSPATKADGVHQGSRRETRPRGRCQGASIQFLALQGAGKRISYYRALYTLSAMPLLRLHRRDFYRSVSTGTSTAKQAPQTNPLLQPNHNHACKTSHAGRRLSCRIPPVRRYYLWQPEAISPSGQASRATFLQEEQVQNIGP